MNHKKKWVVCMAVQVIVQGHVLVAVWDVLVHVLVVASIAVEVNAMWLAVLDVQVAVLAIVPVVVEAIINELF